MERTLIINNVEYEFVDIQFSVAHEINDRDKAYITMALTHDAIIELFPDGTVWKVKTIQDDSGTETYDDFSIYCLSGAVTDNRNNTSTIVMSKMTEMERLIQIIYGGVNA